MLGETIFTQVTLLWNVQRLYTSVQVPIVILRAGPRFSKFSNLFCHEDFSFPLEQFKILKMLLKRIIS